MGVDLGYSSLTMIDAPSMYLSKAVTQTQAARALERTQGFLAAIGEQVRAHESGTT